MRIQVSFEIELEKRLRIEGFTPDCINQYRNQLRELFFYDNSYQGKRIKISDLENLTQEMKDMSKNFIDSQPWEIISKARDNLDLFLYKPNEFLYLIWEIPFDVNNVINLIRNQRVQ